MARLAAVEAALFGQHHPVIEAERVDHGGAHAARGGCADDDHAIAAEQGEKRGEARPEKARRLLLSDNDVSLEPGAIIETISLRSRPSLPAPLASSPRVLFQR